MFRFRTWLRSLRSSRRGRPRRVRPDLLRLEALEERTLLSPCTITDPSMSFG